MLRASAVAPGGGTASYECHWKLSKERGSRADHGIARRRTGSSRTSRQPISGSAALRTDPAGGLRQQLGAQAHAEGRDAAREQPLEQLLLGGEPADRRGLVDVHGTAEHEHGVVVD